MAKQHLDQYGLPARILVQLDVDYMGNVTIEAVRRRWAKAVGKSNAYDGSNSIFIQQANAAEHLDSFPRAAFFGRGKDRDFADGARFYMDSWTFRHMVEGQSD